MKNPNYATKALNNRLRRQKEVQRNIILLISTIILIIVVSILFMSFSIEANDLQHEPTYKYYKSIEVSKGDTLWSIAKANIDSAHYKNTYEYINEIKKMNSLTSDNIISGNYIIVPYYSSEFLSSDTESCTH